MSYLTEMRSITFDMNACIERVRNAITLQNWTYWELEMHRLHAQYLMQGALYEAMRREHNLKREETYDPREVINEQEYFNAS
jgi:hypothetical protein